MANGAGQRLKPHCYTVFDVAKPMYATGKIGLAKLHTVEKVEPDLL